MILESERQRIAELEWVNYAASARLAEVTPGLTVALRPEVILTSSNLFPLPDANHAALLRAGPDTVEALLDEVIAYFQARQLPPCLFVSPACTPADLPQRLARRGFVRQPDEEAWLTLTDTTLVDQIKLKNGSSVRRIARADALPFCQVFMSAFGYPQEFAPLMAEVLAPSVELAGVYHYLAEIEGRPVGTLSLIHHEGYGLLGSGGVIPEARRSGAATNAALQAYTDARAAGLHTIIGQTLAGGKVERTLRLAGFKRAFVRQSYILS